MSIVSERRGAVVFVRLSRAEKMNALTRGMLAELCEIFERVGQEAEVRAVVLTGAGERAFSAGTDIGELARLEAEEEARAASELGQRVCERIEGCGVPVIAAVGGVCAGGGLELALACHLRLASTAARFSLPEIKLGLIPAYGGTQRLARIVGAGRANEMVLTGREIDAAEAHRTGLVNRLTSPAQLLNESETLARELVDLAPLALRACLEAVTRGLELPLAEGLRLEADLFSRLFSTEDMREGTSAFLEKRPPIFQGR